MGSVCFKIFIELQAIDRKTRKLFMEDFTPSLMLTD